MIELRALKLEPGCTYVIEMSQRLSLNEMEGLRRIVGNEADRLGVKFVLIGPHMKIRRESIGTRAGLALRAWMIKHGWIEGPLVYQKQEAEMKDDSTNHSTNFLTGYETPQLHQRRHIGRVERFSNRLAAKILGWRIRQRKAAFLRYLLPLSDWTDIGTFLSEDHYRDWEKETFGYNLNPHLYEGNV